jgi:hypothetical protein
MATLISTRAAIAVMKRDNDKGVLRGVRGIDAWEYVQPA